MTRSAWIAWCAAGILFGVTVGVFITNPVVAVLVIAVVAVVGAIANIEWNERRHG